MTKIAGERADFTIAELVETSGKRSLPVIQKESSVDAVIKAFAESLHTRVLYVLDDERRLVGIISLGQLVRHVFSAYHEPSIHPRRLISLIATETAGDLMRNETVSAGLDEQVSEVLHRMIHANVKEVAVLDEERRIVADLTMVDFLQSYEEEE